MTNSEFWAARPRDIWWLIAAKQQPKVYGKGKGTMTEDDMAALHDEMFPDEVDQ